MEFIKNTIVKGGGEAPKEIVLNSKRVTVPDAKPQQDKHLKVNVLDLIFSGEKFSQSKKTKRALVKWERNGRCQRFGKACRKFDGYRGFCKLFLANGAKQIEIHTACGDRDKDLEELVDLENIPQDVFEMGFEFVGELVMFVGDKEMGFAGFSTGKSIINFARKFTRGLSPVRFGIMVFHGYKIGSDFYLDYITDSDDDDIKQNFMKAVFKDSKCISVIEADYFQIGEGGAVYLNGRQVVEQYDQFAQYLKRKAAKDGHEGYVVSFDRSLLHFDDNSKPTYVDYADKHRTKNAAKCKLDFKFLLYIWRNPDRSVSLSDSIMGDPVHTLPPDSKLCLADLPKDGGKLLANVTCSWVNLTYEKDRPLLDGAPWTDKVTKVSLNGVHQIKQEDICPEKTMPPKLNLVAKAHPHYKAVADAIHEAKKLARKIGMYKPDGTRFADPDHAKAALLFEKIRGDKSMTQYSLKSSAKAGPVTFKFGPGSGSEGSGGSSGALLSCTLVCRCSEIKRKPDDSTKMFEGKTFCVWPTGYEKNDSRFTHIEEIIPTMGGKLIDHGSDEPCDYAVISSYVTANTESFAKWYASHKTTTVILPEMLCKSNFINNIDPSITFANVKVPETPTIKDFFEIGQPLSFYEKKAAAQPPQPPKCDNLPKCRLMQSHKKVKFVREGPAADAICRNCNKIIPPPPPPPAAKKQKTEPVVVVFKGFKQDVFSIWRADDAEEELAKSLEAKISCNDGVVYIDQKRCDKVIVQKREHAVSLKLIEWLAQFPITPQVCLAGCIDDCIDVKKAYDIDASFKLASRV
jgi:hypothetical protein